MNHTPQIKKAIQFAARKHHGQMRVARAELPYVVHPFSVALLVAEAGAHDDVVTAALLHDTIEDTDTTAEEITEAFNERVANLVVLVSEAKEDGGHTLSWHERKNAYLTQLQNASQDALLIAIADKIDNIESRLEEFLHKGDSFLRHWQQPNESYLWFHSEVANIAQKAFPDHALTNRLVEVRAREQATFAEK